MAPPTPPQHPYAPGGSGFPREASPPRRKSRGDSASPARQRRRQHTWDDNTVVPPPPRARRTLLGRPGTAPEAAPAAVAVPSVPRDAQRRPATVRLLSVSPTSCSPSDFPLTCNLPHICSRNTAHSCFFKPLLPAAQNPPQAAPKAPRRRAERLSASPPRPSLYPDALAQSGGRLFLRKGSAAVRAEMKRQEKAEEVGEWMNEMKMIQA